MRREINRKITDIVEAARQMPLEMWIPGTRVSSMCSCIHRIWSAVGTAMVGWMDGWMDGDRTRRDLFPVFWDDTTLILPKRMSICHYSRGRGREEKRTDDE